MRLAIPSILTLLAMLVSASPSSAAVSVHFTYRPDTSDPGQISVAGEFNNWNASADLMSDDDGDGVFEATIEIEPGRYEYKIVVDNVWMEDPVATEQTANPFGEFNSVITIPEGVLAIESSGEGAIAGPSTGAAAGGKTPVRFTFTPPTTNPSLVTVAGEWNGWSMGTDYLADGDGDGTFDGTVKLEPGRYEYKFVVDGVWFEDPLAMEQVDDPHGGLNSVVIVTAGDGSSEPPPTPAKPQTPMAIEYRITAASNEPTEEGNELRIVTFRFVPESAASEVFLAGTFNEWNPTGNLMEGPGEDGAWTLNLTLVPGEHRYKFVADGNWIHDPNAEDLVDDGFGGSNSVIIVDDRYESIAIAEGDGQFRTEGLFLSREQILLTRVSPERVMVTARAFRNDVESVSARVLGPTGQAEFPLTRIGDDGQFAYYQGDVAVGTEEEARLAILLHDGGVTYLLGSDDGKGVSNENLLLINSESVPPFETPDWVADGVVYQIFPDRFRNGNPDNDPDFLEDYYDGARDLPRSGKRNGEYFHLMESWNDHTGLVKSPYRTDGKPDYYSFYGGDLEGVTEKLDHLRDLGVTILYFNPLHQAQSNHKYDAIDYARVDPHFGGDDAFRELVSHAHDRGIRVIIDGVFNHTGKYHYAFLDTKEKGSKSKYWSWYDWKEWPLPPGPIPEDQYMNYYDCWWGYGSLPNLSFDLSLYGEDEMKAKRIEDADPNQDLINHINDVIQFWMGEMDADGIRLDVANEVPVWYWEIFRDQVRSVRPDGGWVIAELWGNAASDLGPHRFDATMNYKYFRDPVLSFIARGAVDADAFDNLLAGGRYGYPLPSAWGSMNLLDSHDTERFLTTAGRDTRRLTLAATFMACYVGMPHIYYGDEIGMEGGPDPDCRRPYRWDEEDEPSRAAIRDHYKSVLAIRAAHPALRRGGFRSIFTDGNLYVFTRELGDDRIAVVLNADRAPAAVQLEGAAISMTGTSARELLTESDIRLEGGVLNLSLEPYSAAVIAY